MKTTNDINTDQCMIARSASLLHNTPIDKLVSIWMSTLKRQIFCRCPALYRLDRHHTPQRYPYARRIVLPAIIAGSVESCNSRAQRDALLASRWHMYTKRVAAASDSTYSRSLP